MTVPTTLQFSFQAWGKREALVDVHYGDFVIKHFRIMRDANGSGLWVGMPRRQKKGREGQEGEWENVVWILDPERKKAFERFVLDAYARERRERQATEAA